VGRAGDKPTPPVNLIADFGAAACCWHSGMLAAILHAQKERAGAGDRLRHGGRLGASGIDDMEFCGTRRLVRPTRQQYAGYGGAFYDTYACADGGHISIGPIES